MNNTNSTYMNVIQYLFTVFFFFLTFPHYCHGKHVRITMPNSQQIRSLERIERILLVPLIIPSQMAVLHSLSLEIPSTLYSWEYLRYLQFASGILSRPYCICHAVPSMLKMLSSFYSTICYIFTPISHFSHGSFPSFWDRVLMLPTLWRN